MNSSFRKAQERYRETAQERLQGQSRMEKTMLGHSLHQSLEMTGLSQYQIFSMTITTLMDITFIFAASIAVMAYLLSHFGSSRGSQLGGQATRGYGAEGNE